MNASRSCFSLPPSVSEPFIEVASIQKLVNGRSDEKDTVPRRNIICPVQIRFSKDLPDIMNSRSIEDRLAAFDADRRTWEASAAGKQFIEHLCAARLPPRITKVVAFALGSIARGDRRERPGPQHAALLSLAAIIRDRTGEEVRCFAQDPEYAPEDRKLLAACGVTVLEHPHGFLEVDEETAVLSIHPNVASTLR